MTKESKRGTRSRLHAQAIIGATNVSKNSNSEKLFPIRATDQAKDKPCPYCNEMFYYLNGVQTHITHTHSNIVSIKGIANPGVMGENVSPMMGKNEHLTDSVMGANGDPTPLTSAMSRTVTKLNLQSHSHVCHQNRRRTT